MNLNSWLDKITALHPREIELGLERIRHVADAMGLNRPAPLVVTVAGTNGKGSCVACLEAIFTAAGFRVGSYTSPHLHVFNERVVIAGDPVDDQSLCDAFQVVEEARGEVSLTYFEFATLAALWIFQSDTLDVALLEVGLGGRLDAVNIIDPDVAVITSIELDHMDWLGPDREAIGAEKAGILRAGSPAVCGDPRPPRSVLQRAAQLQVDLRVVSRDFRWLVQGGTETTRSAADQCLWTWAGKNRGGESVELSGLPPTPLGLDNVAAALQVVKLLPLKVDTQTLKDALGDIFLPGRMETMSRPGHGGRVILDVAHNPAAAARLAERLRSIRAGMQPGGRVITVFAMMADKDINGFYQALESLVDIWYIAQVAEARCMPSSSLVQLLAGKNAVMYPEPFDDAVTAFEIAVRNASPQDVILVTGSFYTVASVREQLLVTQ